MSKLNAGGAKKKKKKKKTFTNTCKGTKPAGDVALLKELLPGDKTAGKGTVLASLKELTTDGNEHLQRRLSHAFGERELLRIYKAYKDQPSRYMLRTGSAPGVTAFLQPRVAGLLDDHHAAAGRMKPHIFRMALRGFLGLELIPGTMALLVAENGCCPTCGEALHSPLLDYWTVFQHLAGCGTGGWWQRNANAITWAVSECYHDVGVQGNTTETMGLSEISSHRPGDFVSNPLSTPAEFNAGGNERHAVDTTICYVSGPSLQDCQTGPQQRQVNMAESRKLTKLNKEVHDGTRSALPAGYRFVPAGITSRGVMGAGLEKLLGWLADYGAKNRGVLTYLGEEGAEVRALLMKRWTQRLSMAVNRTTMEAVWFRVLDIQAAARVRHGGRGALTGTDIRFGGGGEGMIGDG